MITIEEPVISRGETVRLVTLKLAGLRDGGGSCVWVGTGGGVVQAVSKMKLIVKETHRRFMAMLSPTVYS
jgi:hypothetical protein